jgi:hypothetical protein
MEDDIPDHVAVIVIIIKAVKNEVPHEGYYRALCDIIIEYAQEEREIGRAWRPKPSDTIH